MRPASRNWAVRSLLHRAGDLQWSHGWSCSFLPYLALNPIPCPLYSLHPEIQPRTPPQGAGDLVRLFQTMRIHWWLRRERIWLQCKRSGFDPLVRKIPWRREWLPAPVFLPGEFHGQRSLVGYSPWVAKSKTYLRDYHFQPNAGPSQVDQAGLGGVITPPWHFLTAVREESSSAIQSQLSLICINSKLLFSCIRVGMHLALRDTSISFSSSWEQVWASHSHCWMKDADWVEVSNPGISEIWSSTVGTPCHLARSPVLIVRLNNIQEWKIQLHRLHTAQLERTHCPMVILDSSQSPILLPSYWSLFKNQECSG